MSISQIIVPGKSGSGGYRQLVTLPGEPHVYIQGYVNNAYPASRSVAPETTIIPADSPHPDPCETAGTVAGAYSSPINYPLIQKDGLIPIVAFVHITDMHITDAQSPARAEYLSRLQYPVSRLVPIFKLIEAYRPQEPFTTHVLEAMCRSIRELGGGPATNLPLSFAISTGDAVEISQRNELSWYTSLLDGNKKIVPNSGNPAQWEGVGGNTSYDRAYWHPDGTPTGHRPDIALSRYGFPVVPGILKAAIQPFTSTGIGIPWYATIGNHDKLIGGFSRGTALTSRIATGGYKLSLDALPWQRVTRDPGRTINFPTEWISAHFSSLACRSPDASSSATPPGATTYAEHSSGQSRHKLWYAFDSGLLRCLILDTVNPWGGLEGSLDGEQLTWLESELKNGSSQWRRDDGTWIETGLKDKLFMLFSHHPFETLINGYLPIRHRRRRIEAERRVLAYELLTLLSRTRNVILWLNGHTHIHKISFVTALNPEDNTHGIWQITTSSLIDWPQQARVIELAIDKSANNLLVFSTVLDHAAPVDPRSGDLDDPLTLASWSRELAANHWIHRNDGFEPVGHGGCFDRNVIIRIPLRSNVHQLWKS